MIKRFLRILDMIHRLHIRIQQCFHMVRHEIGYADRAYFPVPIKLHHGFPRVHIDLFPVVKVIAACRPVDQIKIQIIQLRLLLLPPLRQLARQVSATYRNRYRESQRR